MAIERTFSIWWTDSKGKHHDTKYAVFCENEEAYQREVEAHEKMVESKGGTIIMTRTNTTIV